MCLFHLSFFLPQTRALSGMSQWGFNRREKRKRGRGISSFTPSLALGLKVINSPPLCPRLRHSVSLDLMTMITIVRIYSLKMVYCVPIKK